MKQFILTVLFFVLTAVSGHAQVTYQQRQLTMDNGLLSNSIRCIVQDQRGFIWMGTGNGLSRYDGVMSVNYSLPEDEGVSLASVTALLVEDDGNLLVGTARGAYRFSFVTERFERLPLEVDTVVTSLSFDKKENVWISTLGKGVFCYNTADGQSYHYPMAETKGRADKVFTDTDNQQWVIASGEEGKLWRLNKSKETFEPLPFQQELPSLPVAMLQTSDGRCWIGTLEQGVVLIGSNNSLQHMPVSSGHCQRLHTMYELSSHQLLLGCDDGLWLFDTNRQSYELYQPFRFVNAIMSDREGGLWVGTAYNGVNYSSPIAHRFTGVVDGCFMHFCEDRLGRVWTASEGGDVRCYQNGRRQAYAGEWQLKGLKPHSFAMDGDNLWIGTYSDGVYLYSITTGRLRHYEAGEQSFYDHNSCTVLRDHNGTIWLATMEGLCRFNRQEDRFERVLKMVSVPVDLDEDAEGRLWVSTQGEGLWRYDGGEKVKTYRSEAGNDRSISDNMVNCLLVDGKGTVWVGTQKGLCCYDADKDLFERVSLDVPQQGVAAMAEDQGVLWLSSEYGILKYEQGKGVQRFTRQDGLEGEQFMTNAVMKASDGRIYFGTITGFNSFYPYQVKVNELLAPVFITQLEINNVLVPVGNWHLPEALSSIKKLDLYSNDKVFSLSFASLSYCSPEKNMYAYMLEGFDKRWNYVGHEHKATYTNLSPGTYIFRVKATNNDGVWSEQEARLIIEVHPPFWWSTYAKIFYVLLFILFIVAIIRLRLKLAERRHRKEIERLNEVKQEELHNARVEFFTTIAHEIRTPVSLIVGPLEQVKQGLSQSSGAPKGISDQLGVIERNAHRLLELVNQLLDFRKLDRNQADVNFVPLNMRELMSEVAANFEPIFRQSKRQFKVTYPDKAFTPVVDREGMVKLLSNLLSNANKYSNSLITMGCRLMDDGTHFCIEVGDDGPGVSKEDQKRMFDPFYQAKDRKPGTGIGLSIVKKIIEQHHGTVTVKSELGRGTAFKIVLPIMQEVSGEPVPVERQERSAETLGENSKNAVELTQQEKPTMLIVDDNEDMLTFLVTTFMDRFEVVPARDGTEAIRILKESLVVKDGQNPTSTVDIIISDWMMEEMDGPELCNRLRQNAATAHIPFILLTAKTDSQSKVAAMEAGVDMFVEKPFAVKYLEACINNLLSRKLKTT